MASQDPKIDSLHQQASAHYLQGEFQEALESWRQLLKLDPEDDRALEGVKLCEMLAEDQSGSAGQSAEQAQAPPPASATSIEGFDDDLEELDAILGGEAAPPSQPAAAPAEDPAEMLNFEFAGPEPQSVDQPAAAPPADPKRQTEGIDLGDGGATETLDLGTTGETPQDVQFEFDPQSLDLQEKAMADQAPSASPSETAAAELRNRVGELLSEAQSLLDSGDREGALSVLNRIAILDESNDAAKGLRELIKSELAAGEQQAEAAVLPEAPPAEVADLAFTETPADEPVVEFDAPPAVAAPPEADSAGAGIEQAVETEQDIDVHAPPEFEEEIQEEQEPSVELAVGMPKRSLRERLAGPKLVIAGGLLAAVTIGGFSAYWFMWGPGASGDAEQAEEGGPSVAGTVPSILPEIPGQESAQGSEAKKSPKIAAQDSEEKIDLDRLEAEADEAYRKGNYSEAVVLYNQLMEADPDNRPAKARLADAAERYRAQKELEERRAEAFDAFNNGNYRAALTMFYRMPAEGNQKRLERYQRNGWYNMGLQALAVGDCSSAKTNFKEAQALDPNDKEVILALDLARICRYSRGEDSYREEVMTMTHRGLDD
jgi:tetratricopeptide (TPR) repeat protein